jgi:hypothetical protein
LKFQRVRKRPFQICLVDGWSNDYRWGRKSYLKMGNNLPQSGENENK